MLTDTAIRQVVTADLERRLKILPLEVVAWRASIKADAGLGIHVSQLDALSDMMDTLAEAQSTQLGEIKNQQDATQFAETYYDLLKQLSGAQEVWRIFGNILGQRRDPELKRAADTADLVAWNCYSTFIEKARLWQVVKNDELREPPLTYLESSLSPSTASRGEQAQILGFALRMYRDLMLPVPIVLYPRDQASSMWMMCAIAHEVGHNLDHDLDSRPDKRLTDEYKKLLIGRVPNTREPQWRRWMNEVFADAIAILLCGAGFAVSIAQWAVPLGPGTSFQKLDSGAVHPPFYLRLRLLAEMLRITGVPQLKDEGDNLFQLWQGLTRPAWELEYEQDVPNIGKLLLEEAVAPLNNNRLIDLRETNGLGFDHEICSRLAIHWLDASKPRPHPQNLGGASFRLVPAAAALAVARTNQHDVAILEDIQKKALLYFDEIIRPVKLSGLPLHQRGYLKDLTRRLRFTTAANGS